MINLLFTLQQLLMPIAQAASGGHEAGHIPVQLVTYQTINVVAMLIGLFWFLKNPVKAHFKERKESFIVASSKATEALKAAEQEKSHLEMTLSKLQDTSHESIKRAQVEADNLKKSIIKDAEEMSKRIRSEAESAAKFEIEKAKNQLRQELVKNAVAAAKQNLNQSINSSEHDRLQTRFIDQMKGVGL